GHGFDAAFARGADEFFLAADHRLSLFGSETLVTTTGQHATTFDVVSQHNTQHAVKESVFRFRFFDRTEDFDPTVHVARHPVGRGDEHFFLTAGLEVVNTAVIKEAVGDRKDFDVLREPRDSAAETTNAANDQVDLHAGRRGGARG